MMENAKDHSENFQKEDYFYEQPTFLNNESLQTTESTHNFILTISIFPFYELKKK